MSEEKDTLKAAKDEILSLMPPEAVQQLEKMGLMEMLVRTNAWMREAEKTLDHHEERIRRLGTLPEKLKDDIGWLRGSTEILQRFIEADTKFRVEQMEMLRKQEQHWETQDKKYDESSEKHRQLIADVSKASVEATDRLTKAVSSLENTIQKAIEDAKRPLMRPTGGL